MADLTITIDAQTLAGVQRAFSEVQRAFANLERAAGQASVRTTTNLARIDAQLSSVARTARNVGLIATGAIGGITTALVRAGSQAIATESTLRVLLGSGERAAKMMEAINREAAQSVMQRATMLRAAQQMLAVGIRPEAILEMLRGIDAGFAAAGASGEELAERIVRALTQIAAKGKLSMEEVRQLNEANVNVLRLLQQELKLTDEQLQKVMGGQLRLTSAQALTAIIGGLSKNFGDLRKEILNTPLGQLSNLRDNIDRLLTTAGTPLARALTELLKEVNEQLIQMTDAGDLVPIAQSLAQAMRDMATVASSLVSALRALLRALASLPEPVRNVVVAIGAISGPVALATAAMAGMIRGVLGLVTALRAIPAAAAAAIAWLGRVTAASGAAAGAGVGAGAAGAAAGAGAGGLFARLGMLRLGLVGLGLAAITASTAPQDIVYSHVLGYVSESDPQRRREIATRAASIMRAELARRGVDYGSLANTRQGQALLRQMAISAVAQARSTTPSSVLAAATGTSLAQLLGADMTAIGIADSGRAARGARGTAPSADQRMRAVLDLAREAAELRVPGIADMIARGDTEGAARAIAEVRRQLEGLLPAYIRLATAEAQRDIGRPLSDRERATVTERTRMDILRSVLDLEERIGDARARQAEQAEMQARAERERIAQMQRELHTLQTRLLEARIAEMPPEQALQALPTLQAMLMAPHVPDLIAGLLTGDRLRAGIGIAEISLVQEQIAKRRRQLEESIAETQRQRAEQQYQIALQAARLERDIARLKAEGAAIVAEDQLQAEREVLQVMHAQYASRQAIEEQQRRVVDAEARYLQAQRDVQLAAQRALQLEIQQLQVAQVRAALTGDIAEAQRIALQRAQAELELTRSQVSVEQIERQMRMLAESADRYNPFALWLRTLEQIGDRLIDSLADALLGLRRWSNVLRDIFVDLARDLLRIILRGLLDPLILAVQAVATQLGRAIFGALGGSRGGAAALGLGALGGALGAAGIGYAVGSAIGLSPGGTAIGAGLGFAVGGPIGGLLGGLLGGLFGRRRRQQQPQVQVIPLSAAQPSLTINNAIRLYLDSREVSRALVQNAL